MDAKRVADMFEEILNEYNRSFSSVLDFNSGDKSKHNLNFIFAKLSEVFVEIEKIKEELKMCKRII